MVLDVMGRVKEQTNMDPLQIVDRLEGQQLLTTRQAGRLRSYYDHHIVSLHIELRLLLGLGSTMLISGLGLLIKDDIPGVVITITIVGAIIAVFLGVNSRYIRGVVRSGLVSMGASLFLVLRAHLEHQYGFFSGQYRSSALALSIIFFLIAYRYENKAVVVMACAALTSFVGLTVHPEAKLFLVGREALGILPLLCMYAIIALAVILYVYHRRLQPDFTIPYTYFYANLLLGCSLAGYVSFDYDTCYFLLLIGSSSGFAVVSSQVKQPILLVVALTYVYIAVTRYTFDRIGLEREAAALYFMVTGALVIGGFFKMRSHFRRPDVSR